MQRILLLFLATFGTCTAAQVGFNPQDFQIDSSSLPELSPENQGKLARIFELTLINYFQNAKVVDPSGNDEDAGILMFPVLPGFEDDEQVLNDVHLHFPNTSDIADRIYGNIHFCDVSAKGFSSFFNDLTFDFPWDRRLTLHFVFKIGKIELEGLQDIDLTLNNQFKITANEKFSFELTNFEFAITVGIESLFQTFNVDEFLIPKLTFDQIRLNFANTNLNGREIKNREWLPLSIALSQALPLVLNNLRPTIQDALKPVIHDLLDECGLWNFIMGDFACVGRPSESENPYPEVQPLLADELSEFVVFSESDICPVQRI